MSDPKSNETPNDADTSGADARRSGDWSREDYAIHVRRNDLPLFGRATQGDRDDASWLTSLSGTLKKATADENTRPAGPPRKRPFTD